MKDPRVSKPADRVLYIALGIYFLIYLVWMAVARGAALFDFAFFMLFILPIIASAVFVIWQFSAKRRRFSVVGNFVGVVLIVGAPVIVLGIVAAASASV